MILQTVSPYLFTVKVAFICKLFAARITPAENLAWLSVVATQLSWTGITVHAAIIPTFSLLVRASARFVVPSLYIIWKLNWDNTSAQRAC